MKKETMKKIVSCLLLSVCAAAAVSCVRIDVSRAVRSGFYMKMDDPMGAYIRLDTTQQTWQSSAGMAISYAESGRYEISGNILETGTALNSGITFEILSENELKVLSVKKAPNADPAFLSWITEGDVFLYQEDPF